MSEELHIVGLVVTAPPWGETALGEAIAQLPGSTVHAAQRGRLVVTIEAADTREMGRRMDAIRELPGVVSVLPVYQHCESLAVMNEEIGDDDDAS
jgi:nitrate reductase NapAB chaperone NapD